MRWVDVGEKARKAVRLFGTSEWRHALIRHRVAATVEHCGVAFESEFRTVVDVGANRGQFALFALTAFPGARVLCFEPLAEARAKLERVVGTQRVESYAVALGSSSGSAALRVTAREDSSSLLAPTAEQLEAFPGTHEKRQATVTLERLDVALEGSLVRPSLLKIDVQGLELEVLRGASTRLDEVDEVLVECSFLELYAGQPLAGEVVTYILDRGFHLRGVHSVVKARTGRCAQADFHFIRV